MDSKKKALLLLNLKKNKFIRILFYPLQNIKRRLLLLYYKKTKYSKNLLALKNTCVNKRCFIIGNGPSLTAYDLDKLRNEYSFAANRIYYMFDKTAWRPTFYCCIDQEVFVDINSKIDSIETKYKFIEIMCKPHRKLREKFYGIYNYSRFYLDKYEADKPFISEHPELFLSNGGTVTFASIQLALFLGFKEIYLLGVDHNYSLDGKGNYFDGASNSVLPPPPNLNTMTMAYQAAREYADQHNIKIYNATRGGKLEAFERIDFDKLKFKG